MPALPLSPHCPLSWCNPPPSCKVPSVGPFALAGGSGSHWQKASPALPKQWGASALPGASLPPAVLLPAASCPSRVLIGFLELYMGLLLSLYILFWALAWGHLFSVSMWRVSRSPVLL